MNVDVPPVNILSICTGGGGLDLGIELAVPSARSVCMVEREAFAVAQLVAAMEAGHVAPAPVWSDARTFDGKPWRGLVDGFIGGIPCQPHSLAGRKQGQHDARDLWTDARRIVVQSRPWFVLIENVEGMLSAGDDEIAGAERVWRDLRKLGFEVEGGLFTAAEVGASHPRERIFILGVGNPAGQRPHASAFPRADSRDESGRSRDAKSQRRSGQLADTDSERLEGQWANAGARGREDAWRPSGLRDGTALVHAERPERWPDADRGHEPYRNDAGRDQEAGWTGKPSAALVNAEVERWGEGWAEPSLRRRRGAVAEPSSLFPPGPSDLPSWRDTLERAPELEPAFRRVADGLASRLDIARVDRLRLLGNGVVPLAAAHAFRTLVHRLAERGSAGANELVRLMHTPILRSGHDTAQ